MSYTPTATVNSNLHSIVDPNGGTCCTDGAGATPSTTAGATILSNKDSISTLVASKVGTRTLSLATLNGILTVRCDNSAIGSNTTGAGLQYTTGTLDPATFSVVMCISTDRRCKLVADMLFDAANTPSTSAFDVQIAYDAGNIKRSGGSGFSNIGSPFLQASNRPFLLGLSVSAGTMTFYRRDFYDSGGTLIGMSGGATISSTPAGAGYTILGRQNGNLWTQGNLFLSSVCTVALTAAQMKAEMDAMASYLHGLSGSTLNLVGTPSAPALNGAPVLITNGDSNECGTGAARITSEWGYLLQQDLITAGVAGLQWLSLGAGSRQVTHADDLEQVIADFANATTGRALYVLHCGENDMNGAVNYATTLTREQTHFSNLNTLSRKLGIVALGVPARTDISGATLTNYDTDRSSLRTSMLADPLMSGRVIGYVDITGDANLGANGASNTTTYFNGDKVHYNSAGCTKMYSTTGGTGETLLTMAKRFYLGGGTRVKGKSLRGVEKGLERGRW